MAYRSESTKSMVPCMFCIGFFGVMALVVTIFGAIIPLNNFYNLELQQCNVTKVEYPTSLPTADDSSNWVECDCGRRCISWSPCTKIYTNNDNTTYMLENIYSYSNDDCTLSEPNCFESEDVIVLQEELRLAIARAESYVNATIPCFYNDFTGFYYTSDYLNEPAVYFYLIMTGLLIIILVIMSVCYCKGKRKDSHVEVNHLTDEYYGSSSSAKTGYQTGYPPNYDNI